MSTKKAAHKPVRRKAPPKFFKTGVISFPDEDCCEPCTMGFNGSAIDLARRLPRKVVATLRPMKGEGGAAIWNDGKTPFMTVTLSEVPVKPSATAKKKTAKK